MSETICAYCGVWMTADAWNQRELRHCSDGCRDAAGIVAWLVDCGYPWDFQTETYPPDGVMRALIEAWRCRERESFDDIAWSVEQECGYQLPEVPDPTHTTHEPTPTTPYAATSKP